MQMSPQAKPNMKYLQTMEVWDGFPFEWGMEMSPNVWGVNLNQQSSDEWYNKWDNNSHNNYLSI